MALKKDLLGSLARSNNAKDDVSEEFLKPIHNLKADNQKLSAENEKLRSILQEIEGDVKTLSRYSNSEKSHNAVSQIKKILILANL